MNQENKKPVHNKSLDNISIEVIKEIVKNTFKEEQERNVRKTVSSCNKDRSEEIKDNDERLNVMNKETEDLKLNLDASEEIM